MRAMKLRLPFLKKTTSVNVVRLHGMIGTGGRSALNDAALAPVLERAFSKGKPAAVAISVNSPGGSPVQSSLIGSRIRRCPRKRKSQFSPLSRMWRHLVGIGWPLALMKFLRTLRQLLGQSV